MSEQLPSDVPILQVFFDVEIDGKPAGRITMGLFGKVGNRAEQVMRSHRRDSCQLREGSTTPRLSR